MDTFLIIRIISRSDGYVIEITFIYYLLGKSAFTVQVSKALNPFCIEYVRYNAFDRPYC